MIIDEVRSSTTYGSRFVRDGKPCDVTYKIVNLEEARVCVFYDSEYELLFEPSAFITYELNETAENSAYQAATAIKLLLSFSEAIGVPFKDFDRHEALGYLMFLRGTLSTGVTNTFELNTQRAETTVAAYLKHVRSYARYLGIEGSPFLESRDIKHEFAESMRKYGEMRLRATPAPQFEAPRYINLDQFKRILITLQEKGDDAGVLICRLMFEHGLRIGEVLGLTLEDVKNALDGNGGMRYWLVLRNRGSDRLWMNAKNLIKATTKAVYSSPEYRRRRVGCHNVYISESLYMALVDYIEAVHGEGLDGCAADSVGELDHNEYLFVSKRGAPLSSNAWNKRLRVAMADSDVPVDERARVTNLNHRFRHGYAMMLTNELGKSEYEVMTLMRHRSIKTTEIYHRPTEEDVWRMQLGIIGEIETELFGGDSAWKPDPDTAG